MATTEQFALPRERSNSFEKFRPSDARPAEPRFDDFQEENYHIRDDDEDNDKRYDMDEHYEDEDDEPVDPSVKEDMKKLEDTFTGISKRFRLINRIGEGTYAIDHFTLPALTSLFQVHFRPCTKQRIYCTINTRTIGTPTTSWMRKIGESPKNAALATMSRKTYQAMASQKRNHDMSR